MTLVTSSVEGQTNHYWFGPNTYTPKDNTNLVNSIKGRYKWISDLNNQGSFTPGEFRANPVVIGESFCSKCEPGRIDVVTKSKYYGYYYRIILDGVPASWGARYVTYVGNYSPSSWVTSMSKSLMDGSLESAYGKLLEPEFDLGTTLGELKETILGLVNLLSALRLYIKQYKHLMSISVKEWQRNKNAVLSKRNRYYQLNALGGSWLEWRMGIYPLIKTLEDLWEHLTDPIVDLDERLRRVRATLKSEDETVSNTSYRLGAGGPYVHGTLTRKQTWKASTSVYYTRTIPLTFGERYGTDLSSLPNVAWELTRLSFVVDRFIRIGDFLSYIRGVTSGKFDVVGTSTSLKWTKVDLYRMTGLTWIPKIPPIKQYEHEVTTRVLDRRINLTLPLLPTVNWRSLSIQQWFDHAALIWQAIPQPNWKKEMNKAYRLDQEFRKLNLPKKFSRKFK